MKRSYEAEIMDDFSIRDGRIDEALHELKIINKYLGGIATTKSALKYFLDFSGKELSVLDIGSGSSDNLIAAKENYPAIKIISIDKNYRALSSSKNLLEKINSDAFDLPFKNKSFDFVHASLFLHHFTYEQINKLMREFIRIARSGIIINDLQRSCFALIGIKILTVLFSKSEMVKNDAPISLKRGFKKQEILKLLSDAGVTDFVIKKKWAFRWMVVVKK